MRTLVALAMDRLGGLENFAREWLAHWERVREQSIGSRAALNSYATVANLIATNAALTPPRPIDDLTDSELDESIDRDIENFIVQNPEIVRAAAQFHGLIPPPAAE